MSVPIGINATPASILVLALMPKSDSEAAPEVVYIVVSDSDIEEECGSTDSEEIYSPSAV